MEYLINTFFCVIRLCIPSANKFLNDFGHDFPTDEDFLISRLFFLKIRKLFSNIFKTRNICNNIRT